MDISRRQIEILHQIIEEYAETATPVGSVTMAKLFGVSPATIRAEMARLERLGLIAQPHTSAGRVPTDAGYRFYVNELTEAGALKGPMSEGSSIGAGMASESTSESSLTEAGDITRPIRRDFLETNREEMAPELRLGSGSKLDDDIRRSTHVIKVRISSQSRADAAIRGAADALVDLTGNLALATIGDQLYLSGLTRLFTQPEFTNIARVQAVARLLDNLEPWLREASPGEPLNIFIGKENPVGKNSEVSLIISKFRSPYSDRSYIGVLGPTRQNYSRVMRLVQETGNSLEMILRVE